MKQCTKCKSWFCLSQFYRSKQTRDGFHSWCKTCVNDAIKLYRQSDKGKQVYRKWLLKHYPHPHKPRSGGRILGEKNINWLGDDVSYSGLHRWLRRHISKPNVCPGCKRSVSLEMVNITGFYTREFKNWQWLCRRCHMTIDGRIKTFMIPRFFTAKRDLRTGQFIG